MKKRDKKKHPHGWAYTQHGSCGECDADLTPYPCDYRDEFTCGFCNGSDEQKRSCERYYNLLNQDVSDCGQPEYDHYPDADIPRNSCGYRDRIICKNCDETEREKDICARHHYLEWKIETTKIDIPKDMKINLPEGCEFLLHGDEPGSKARGKSFWYSEPFSDAIKKHVVDEIKPAETMASVAKRLANEHWSYIESLLNVHGIDKGIIGIVGWHYRKAMEHGFKHGIEYMESYER